MEMEQALRQMERIRKLEQQKRPENPQPNISVKINYRPSRPEQDLVNPNSLFKSKGERL